MLTASFAKDPTPKESPFDTKLHLAVRISSRALRSAEISLHCKYPQVHSDPGVVISVRVLCMSQIDLFEIMFKMIVNYITFALRP